MAFGYENETSRDSEIVNDDPDGLLVNENDDGDEKNSAQT